MTTAGLWTWEDVAILKGAIMTAVSNGSWQIQTLLFENQSVTLRSLEEARKLLEAMMAQLGATGQGVTRYVTTSKGL